MEYLKSEFLSFCVFLADEDTEIETKFLGALAVFLISLCILIFMVLIGTAVIESHGLLLIPLFIIYLVFKTLHFIGKMTIRADKDEKND